MAKRSRKPSRVARPQQYSKGKAPSQPVAQAASVAPTRQTLAHSVAITAPMTAPKVDFAKEYHYVIQDLRRLFILAIALIALLITLAYFLT
jgi:hypothetical protein